MERVGLAMTLLLQSPCACKSPGAVAQPSREGRQCFLPKHESGRELSPLNRTMRLPSTHSSNQMLHGNIKPLMLSSALPQEGVGTPGTAPPLPNHPSHEPLPNKSHHDAKQRRRASAGREIPCMRPGEAGTASPPHPPLPSRSGCRHSPPLPALPSTPGCFLPARDLPDLLNKPPSSGKPTTFLLGKVVKGSDGCWKRQGVEQAYKTKPSSAGTKRVVGVWVFFFPLRLRHKSKTEIGITACRGGSFLPPVPPGRVSPAKPRWSRDASHRTRVQHCHAVPPPGLGFRCGVQGGKAVRACDSRPASPKNAIIVMNNFLASGGICTPHPLWAVSLFLETVFLGI